MAGGFPALSGNELIKILIKSKELGCCLGERARHGQMIIRETGGCRYFAPIPTKDDSLPKGTLAAILRELKLSKEELQPYL